MTSDTIDNDVTIPGGSGTLLANRFRIVKQLGQGGMGSVWLAEDIQLYNKPFAIKMLPSILVSNKRAYAQLKSEALVAMKLVHPNIVQLRAFEENNGNPFLVMDYVDGETLDDYLADVATASSPSRNGGDAIATSGIPESEVIRLLKPIAAALDYAHSQGVVHRDVKPGNVMISKDGTPYILDFGIAREIQETVTRVTGKLSSGTLLYMSPEQLNGDAPRPAQDVYSFAAMAYECLKGEPPFSRGNIEFQIMNKQPEPLVDVSAAGSLSVGVNGQAARSTSIAASVMAGLAKKPEDRPATCVDVLNDSDIPRIRQSQGNNVPRREGSAAVFRKLLIIAGLFLLALLAVWWCTGGHSGSGWTAPENGNGGEEVHVVARPLPPVVPETNEAKARRAQALYEQGKGRQILEEFSAYDAEMVPEIAFLKGIVYRDGMSGMPVDTRKAAQMFTLAANRGHVQAQLDLSVMYAQGIGVQRSVDQFIHWAEKAADQGVVDAAFNLGYMYFSAEENGKVKPDYAKALKYLKIAAEGGRPAACGYIGSMYVKGFGVPVDHMEAVKWFKMGAEGGDALSENNLGYMYLKGYGVAKNTELAIKYLSLADSHGNSGAAMSLGLMYENGDGVPKDLDKARDLYRRAKELGVGKEADTALERLTGACGGAVQASNAQAAKQETASGSRLRGRRLSDSP